MRIHRFLSLALAATLAVNVAACGQTTPPSPTAAATAESTKAAPTAEPTPRTAAQAGGSLKPGTEQATPSIAKPADAVSGPVLVDALYFMGGNGNAKGGTAPVKIRVEKNGAKELRVGFFEEEVGGSGPMWRAAGWMAVITASFLLGVDPTDYNFQYDVGGNIDGPSAGCLMTVGTIAAILGDKVKADVTMTGTINPDGTVGPVGGIPQKIDGAAAKGKTLILVPAGSRMSIDENSGQPVDVVDRGKRLSVTVKEVVDIYEAYEQLTGKALPKPAGLKDTRPELPGNAYDRTKSKAKEWFSRYWTLKGQYESLPSKARFDFTDALFADAEANGDQADKYYGQGLPAAAYSRSVEATLNASIGYHSAKVIESYVNGDLDSAFSYLKSMRAVGTKADGLLDRLGTQKPNTLSDSIALADAYTSVNQAMSLMKIADNVLETDVSSEEEALTVLTMATLYYAVADHSIELAKDSIDIGWGFGSAPTPDDARVAALAELFRRAADANLNYFNSVVLDQIAAANGMRLDAVKAAFANRDFDYTLAVTAGQNIVELKQRVGPGSPSSHATLGAAMNSYVLSSGLIAKYYSIGVKLDEDGSVIGVNDDRKMINTLDFAERRSREMVGLAISVGADPVQPVIYYEEGKARREGDVSAKFNALTNFWTSVMQSQAIAVLSGKANVVSSR